ncbi:hypothetical protein [uncultured Ruegeria sp.]|uniref:hypothetical protein n=1 Tax=uncultured Ruegeria sp. TaxID=259304 RepID=UPI00260291F2|nr:hypothetical protein [uncultured Ruegeria sp.]
MEQPVTDSERLETLNHLAAQVDRRAAVDRDFVRAIGTLPEDLTYVTNALTSDPQLWRQNRAFHVVHVPSFIAIFAMLEDMDQMTSISEDERHQVYASINRAATLAKEARQRIEGSSFAEARVNLEVLAEYAPSPVEPYKKASRFTRALDGLSSASETVWSGAKSHASSVPGLMGSLQDGVSDTMSRASSVPELAANLHKTVSAALSDNVTSPISIRLDASGRALRNGVGTGVGLGVVVGVLCPPLLPLTAGGAVLAAMHTWRKEMDRARVLSEEERTVRVAELKAEREASLRKLTQGAQALQMETDDISMTLDVESGEADAVVLTGDYAGRMWSSMSTAEKAETGLLLAEGANNLLSILEIAIRD